MLKQISRKKISLVLVKDLRDIWDENQVIIPRTEMGEYFVAESSLTVYLE
jgi:hypothetical protein